MQLVRGKKVKHLPVTHLVAWVDDVIEPDLDRQLQQRDEEAASHVHRDGRYP